MYSLKDLKRFYDIAKTSRSKEEAIKRFSVNATNNKREKPDLDNLRIIISRYLTIQNPLMIIKDKGNSTKIAYAKNLFYYFAYNELQETYQSIGKYVGKHHATVLNGKKKIEGFIDIKDDSIIRDVKNIKSILIDEL
jgi:chromosomal replication initiation ATPase DnaA